MLTQWRLGSQNVHRLQEEFQTSSPASSTLETRALAAIANFFPILNAYPTSLSRRSDISGVLTTWLAYASATAASTSYRVGNWSTLDSSLVSSYTLSFSYTNRATDSTAVLRNVVVNTQTLPNITLSINPQIITRTQNCNHYSSRHTCGDINTTSVFLAQTSGQGTYNNSCFSQFPRYEAGTCIGRDGRARVTVLGPPQTITTTTDGTGSVTVTFNINPSNIFRIAFDISVSTLTLTESSISYTSAQRYIKNIPNTVEGLINDFTNIYTALLIDLYNDINSRHSPSSAPVPLPARTPTPITASNDRTNAMNGTNVTTLQSQYITNLQILYGPIYTQTKTIMDLFETWWSVIPAATKTSDYPTLSDAGTATITSVITDLSGWRALPASLPTTVTVLTLVTNLAGVTNMYNKYQGSYNRLIAFIGAQAANLRSLYSTARFYIADSDLLPSTRTILTSTNPTLTELTEATRDILGDAINRYMFLNPAKNPADLATAITSTNHAVGSLSTDDTVVGKNLAELQTIRERYFGATGLWPNLIQNSTDGLSKKVADYIRTFQTNATAVGVTLNASNIALDISGTDLSNVDFINNLVNYGRSSVANPWFALGTGLNSWCYALAFGTDGFLYAGGLFSTAGGISANCIARWNGSAWSALGTGLNGTCHTLTFGPDGFLYAGGWFTTAGGISVSGVARWNGSAWSALGTGLNGTCHTLTFGSDGFLYAGGNFTTAGGVTVDRVARWNGSAWTNIGTGLNGTCHTLTFGSDGFLYAGGDFTTAGGVTANRIARWNGSDWSALGTGLNNTCFALTFGPDGFLYAGGNFTTAGGISTSFIARWNGTAWSALGTGFNGTFRALAFSPDGFLYAGGSFSTAGDVSASFIARLIGSTWSALGTGLDSWCYALAFGQGILYAGGGFTTAGGVTVTRIARFTPPSYLGSTATFLHALNELYQKYKAQAILITYRQVRAYLTDAEIASPVTISTSLNTTDYLSARRAIFKALINKYYLINPSGDGTTLVPTFDITAQATGIPATDVVTDTTTDSQMDTLETKYLTGSTALWPPLLSRYRTETSNMIDSYSANKSSAGVTLTGAANIADTDFPTDRISIDISNSLQLVSGAFKYGRSVLPAISRNFNTNRWGGLSYDHDNKILYSGFNNSGTEFISAMDLTLSTPTWVSIQNNLPTKLNGSVNAIQYIGGGRIVVGGSFTLPYTRIALVTAAVSGSPRTITWSWQTIENAPASRKVNAFALDVSSSLLFVGGDAIYAMQTTGTTLRRISTLNTNSECLALVYDASRRFLYMGGMGSSTIISNGPTTITPLNRLGGTTISYVAYLNLSSFTFPSANLDLSGVAMGAGLNNEVFALTLDNLGRLYAGGNFTDTGMARIARWSGSAWEGLNSATQIASTVQTLATDPITNDIIVGGGFTNRIIKLIGNTWTPFGNMLRNSGDSDNSTTIRSLFQAPTGELFASGNFGGYDLSGARVLNNLTRWTASPTTATNNFTTTLQESQITLSTTAPTSATNTLTRIFDLSGGYDLSGVLPIIITIPRTTYFTVTFLSSSNVTTMNIGVLHDNGTINSPGTITRSGNPITYSLTIPGISTTAISPFTQIRIFNNITTSSPPIRIYNMQITLPLSSTGVIQLPSTTFVGDTPSFISVVRTIYDKYKIANDAILTSLRATATDARASYNALRTALSACGLSTTPSTVATANADYDADGTSISNTTDRTVINAFSTKYNTARTALFNQVLSDQQAVIARYSKLHGKYVQFVEDSAVPKYGATLATIPSTLPLGSVNPISGITANTENISANVTTLSTFCTNYNTPSTGHYDQLVSHIRAELSKYVREFDRRWAALADSVKAGISYTSLIPSGQTVIPTTVSDVTLYDSMNAYAGYPRDNLTTAGPSVAGPAPSGFRTTLSTAQSQYDALVQLMDFGAIYLRLQRIIESATVPPAITTLQATVTTILANPATNLDLAVRTVTSTTTPTFATTFANMITQAQTRLNALLTDYMTLHRMYSTMVSDLSGVRGLPDLANLTQPVPTWFGTTPMSGFAYTGPNSGNYTPIVIEDGFSLYGSLSNWSSFSSFLRFIDRFQSLVSSVQTNLNGFIGTLATTITTPTLPTIAIDSVTTDSLSTTSQKYLTVSRDIETLLRIMTIWYMRRLLVDTYNPGIRFLGANDLDNDTKSIINRCQIYVYNGNVERITATTTTISYMGTDRAGTLVPACIAGIRAMTQKLAERYKMTWATWITGGRIRLSGTTTISGATSQSDRIDGDITDGSEAARVLYLAEWPKLIGDIKSATQSLVTQTIQLNSWRTSGTNVDGTQTTGLGISF